MRGIPNGELLESALGTGLVVAKHAPTLFQLVRFPALTAVPRHKDHKVMSSYIRLETSSMIRVVQRTESWKVKEGDHAAYIAGSGSLMTLDDYMKTKGKLRGYQSQYIFPVTQPLIVWSFPVQMSMIYTVSLFYFFDTIFEHAPVRASPPSEGQVHSSSTPSFEYNVPGPKSRASNYCKVK